MTRFRPSRSDNHLSNYWNALVRHAPPEELARLARLVEPSEIAAIERAHAAHQRYEPDPVFARRLEQTIMDATFSAIADTIPQPRVSPPSRNGSRDPGPVSRRRALAPPSRTGWPLRPAVAIGMVILLVLASAGGIWWATIRQDEPHRLMAPVVATPSADAPPDVPMYKANPERTGVMPGPGINGSPVEMWHVNVPGEVTTQPAIVDGVMYAGANNGVVYALDITTGTTVWTFAGSSAIVTSPAVSDGLLYVGSEDGTLNALAMDDGSTIWSLPVATSVGTPLIADGTLYVGGGDGILYALDPATGTERWRSSIGAGPSSSGAFADGVVYQATTDSILHAVDAQTGESRWAVQLEGAQLTTPTVSDGVVYQGTKDGAGLNPAYALDAATGEELWRFGAQTSEGYGSPTIGETLVYFTSNDRNVYALDRASGTLAWQYETSGQIWASPALVGDTLYVSGRDQTLYALDAGTGAERWRYAVDGPIGAIPAITGGVAYFGTDFGTIYAIGSSDMLAARNLATPTVEADTPLPAAATPAATPVALQQAPSLLWSSTGNPDQPLDRSLTATIAPDGTIWVADGGHSQFQLFSPDGTWLESWGGAGQGSGDGQFNFLRANSGGDSFGAVAFAPDGTYYVADTGNQRIQHFSADRTFLNAWGAFGPQDGQFISPIDLAVDADGMVYVGDDKRGDLQVFAADGTFVRSFGAHGDPEFRGWITLEPDGTIWGAGGSGSPNNIGVLHQWTTEGDLLRTIPVSTSDGEPVIVGDVTFDSDGNMWVPDGDHGLYILLDPEGQWLAEWSEDADGNPFRTGISVLDATGAGYGVGYDGVLVKYQFTSPADTASASPGATPTN